MITTNKLFIITSLLAGMSFMLSCSKAPEANAGKTQKSTPAPAVKNIPIDARNSLTAVRNGQQVTLGWRIDATIGAFDQIQIVRSPTGKGKRSVVAELPPDAAGFKDFLPNENAHWYWLQLPGKGNALLEIGPVMVNPDKAGPAGYINPEDKYKVTITRTEAQAVISWDFPEDEYKRIRVVRNTRPMSQPFSGRAAHVLNTQVCKSQYTNALSAPNSEYWYWFQITLKSGAIYYKGPIKAEFARRGPPAAGGNK